MLLAKKREITSCSPSCSRSGHHLPAIQVCWREVNTQSTQPYNACPVHTWGGRAEVSVCWWWKSELCFSLILNQRDMASFCPCTVDDAWLHWVSNTLTMQTLWSNHPYMYKSFCCVYLELVCNFSYQQNKCRLLRALVLSPILSNQRFRQYYVLHSVTQCFLPSTGDLSTDIEPNRCS